MSEHAIDLSALAKSREGGAHSIFSASSSPRWMACAGSLLPNLFAPDDSGIEAAEGTVAHSVGETWLSLGKKPRHLIGTTQTIVRDKVSFDIEITHEMLDQVQRYVDYCWSLPGSHYVETHVEYSDIMPIPKQGGTADHAACEYQHLIITDLKYGKGVQVFAKDNSQLMLYAYGFFLEYDFLYDFQKITLRIAQPRLDHFDEHVITREDLEWFADFVKIRAYAAWKLDAPRKPGDKQCRFCRVKATCGAYAKYVIDMTEDVYQNLESEVTPEAIETLKERIEWMVPPHQHPAAELTLEHLSILYSWRGSVESWFKHVANEIGRRAAHGEHPPLQKLVEARSHRAYRNVEEAKWYLVEELDLPPEEVVVETLVSPAELERVLRKHGHRREELPALLAPVVFKPPGRPTLAPLSDRRPALRDVDDGVFKDLNETDENEEP